MRRSDQLTERRLIGSLKERGITPRQGEGKVVAMLNEGRWVASCPCRGAEFVREGAPMVCGSCGMVRDVTWPKQVAEIEAAVSNRPTINQNWLPGETVAMLKAENKAHE
jgi:hypothetical protein